MKLLRSLLALPLVLMLAFSARASQDSYVLPTTGPMSLGTLIGTHLNPGLRAIVSCHSGSSTPANGPSGAPVAQQCWWDTSGTPWVLKYWDGVSWVAAANLNASTHVFSTASPLNLSGSVTPTQLTGDQDDYTATLAGNSCVNNTVLRLSTDATRNVTGLSCGQSDGTFRLIENVGSNTLVLKNQNASSIAANRFQFTADVTLAANTQLAIVYDATSLVWRPWSRALANSGVTAGSYGTATAAPQCVFDVQGRATSCANVTVTPAWGSIIGTPTTLSGYGITDGQPLDGDLTALANNSTSGLWARTGAGTGNARTITPPSAGISVADGDGVAGNPTLSLANDLAAVEALSGTGIARRTGTDAWSVGTTTSLAEGGTSQVTAAAARAASGLNVESLATTGDANVSIAATTRTQATSATLTAARAWTLPAANALNPGQTLTVSDAFGGINGANTITLTRAGADTINGVTTLVLTAQYQQVQVVSDGTSKWTVNPAGIGAGGGTVSAVVCGAITVSTSGECPAIPTPKQYGATCNATEITGNVTITAGSPNLLASSAAFAVGDVGKIISVPGAGPLRGTAITANVTIGSGSPNLLVAGASFAANADTGRALSLTGAGVAGATLFTTILSVTDSINVVLSSNASTALSASSQTVTYGNYTTLVTTILSRTNSTNVVLNANATTAISAASRKVVYFTDDTTFIQNALNDTAFGALDFSNSGGCGATGLLTLSIPKTIFGGSTSKIYHRQSATGANVGGVRFASGSAKAWLRNISIDYDAGNATSLGNDAIDIFEPNITIDKIYLDGNRTYNLPGISGIAVRDPVSKIYVRHSTINNVTGHGIYVGNADHVIVERNHVTNIGNASTALHANNSTTALVFRNLQFLNNYVNIGDLSVATAGSGVYVYGHASNYTTGVVVDGNDFTGTTGSQTTSAGALCSYCDNARISNNKFSSFGEAIGFGTVNYGSITGNTAEVPTEYMIELNGGIGLTVIGNTVLGNSNTNWGIIVYGDTEATIVGNNLNGLVKAGIANGTTNTKKLTIANNLIQLAGTVSPRAGIYTTALASVSVTGNIVKSTSGEKCIYLSGTPVASVSGNTCDTFSDGVYIETNGVSTTRLSGGNNTFTAVTRKWTFSTAGGGTFGTDISVGDANGFFTANRNGSNQTGMASDTFVKILLNSTSAGNAEGWFDTATNNRYSPLIPGIYPITVQCTVTTSSTNGPLASIYKNGVGLAHGSYAQSLTAGEIHSVVHYPVPITLGDYVEGFCFTGNSTAINGDASKTYMHGQRLPSGY